MLISEVLNQRPKETPESVVFCSVSDNVNMAITRMSENGIGAVLVCGDEGVSGIFTERDVLDGIRRGGAPFLNETLERTMSSNVIVVRPDQNVDEAMELMSEHRVRHLPVVDGDNVVSVLSMRDLFAHKLSRAKTTAEFLKRQVQISSKPLPM